MGFFSAGNNSASMAFCRKRREHECALQRPLDRSPEGIRRHRIIDLLLPVQDLENCLIKGQ